MNLFARLHDGPDPRVTPVEAEGSRTVVKCPKCNLVQFRRESSVCRRCKTEIPDTPGSIRLVHPTLLDHDASISGSETIGQIIRRLRLSRGMSQRDLALRMSIPRTYISKIENGKAFPKEDSLIRFASALEVEIVELQGEHLYDFKTLSDKDVPKVFQNRKSIQLQAFINYKNLIERAVEAFGDELVASNWLSTPSNDFDGSPPIEVAKQNNYDVTVLEGVLIRIEHGVDF